MSTFEVDEDERHEIAEGYIATDLPSITQFSQEQKGAIASCIFLDLARGLNDSQRSVPFYFFDDPPDHKAIELLLAKAIKNYRTKPRSP